MIDFLAWAWPFLVQDLPKVANELLLLLLCRLLGGLGRSACLLLLWWWLLPLRPSAFWLCLGLLVVVSSCLVHPCELFELVISSLVFGFLQVDVCLLEKLEVIISGGLVNGGVLRQGL